MGMDRLLIMAWEMDWVLVCGPVGNGYGPAFDYGLGDGPGTCLWPSRQWVWTGF